MPVTKVEIANRALTKIRAQPLTTFQDGTAQADVVDQVYDSFAQNILTIGNWHFATKKQQLSQSTTTPINQWSYIYNLPADFLKLITVWDSSGTHILSVNEFELYEERNLYSNLDGLWIDYLYYINESYWPPHFVEFAITALAAELAMPITGDANMTQLYYAQAYGSPADNGQGGLYAKSAQQDAMQNPNEMFKLDYLTGSRFSIGGGLDGRYPYL